MEKTITKDMLVNEDGTGRYITIIDRTKANACSKFQPETVINGDFADQTRKIKVNSVEDRGDFFYVGYKPVDLSASWGYTRIYKDISTQKYGTIEVIPENED